MPDNVVITAGANATPLGGTRVATDEVIIGGALVQCQRIKLVLGAANAYDLDLDSGQQVMANSLPVVIASDQSAVPVTIEDNVAAAFDHGSNSAIGLAATRFIVASVPATLGVEVKAANSNTANIYVGNVDVTAATVDATDGMELGPGESILVRMDDVNKLYGISTLVSQRVFWLVV